MLALHCSVSVIAQHDPCLCVFDVDRTLTGKQKVGDHCPANKRYDGVWDSAYGGGPLSLSNLARQLPQTFCATCYMGIITAGDVSGHNSAERALIVKQLTAAPMRGFGGGTAPTWSDTNHGNTPLLVKQSDGTKLQAISRILAWYKEKSNGRVHIADKAVFFFDDKRSNVVPFEWGRYNARQVSCATRDPAQLTGLCGGTVKEIQRTEGVILCDEHVPAAQGGYPTSAEGQQWCGTEGCASVWDSVAEEFSCGNRIKWLVKYRSKEHREACTQVAAEYPHICQACKPI